MYKLSIIIPTFNKLKFTQSCLNDLSKLNKYNEITIIDNGSTDGTVDYVYNFCKNNDNFRVIFNDQNYGFAKACNKAYEVATSENVLFLNNDIRVLSDFENWTDKLIENCDKGLCGPTFGLLDKKLEFVQESDQKLNGNSYLSGWCLAGSKNHFNQLILPKHVGPFCEDTFCYFEDTDLSFRARKQNINLDCVSVPVVHFGKVSSSQLNTSKLYSEARKIFHKKWLK